MELNCGKIRLVSKSRLRSTWLNKQGFIRDRVKGELSLLTIFQQYFCDTVLAEMQWQCQSPSLEFQRIIDGIKDLEGLQELDNPKVCKKSLIIKKMIIVSSLQLCNRLKEKEKEPARYRGICQRRVTIDHLTAIQSIIIKIQNHLKQIQLINKNDLGVIFLNANYWIREDLIGKDSKGRAVESDIVKHCQSPFVYQNPDCSMILASKDRIRLKLQKILPLFSPKVDMALKARFDQWNLVEKEFFRTVLEMVKRVFAYSKSISVTTSREIVRIREVANEIDQESADCSQSVLIAWLIKRIMRVVDQYIRIAIERGQLLQLRHLSCYRWREEEAPKVLKTKFI